MNILRWMAVAFSMYSRIPMPSFKWRDDDMSKGLMFFPLIGAVIGAISVGFYMLAVNQGYPVLLNVAVLGLVPIVITGGFHIDGFMDMTDALRSYQPKEKKLEILKDPHIGAFAVIGVIGVMLTYLVGLTLLTDKWNIRVMICYGLIFVMSRAISGISAISLKKAKKSGMLHEETKNKSKMVKCVLVLEFVAAVAGMVYINSDVAAVILAALTAVFFYYKYTVYKQFGGVTGDTAGFFVTVSETWMVVALGIAVWYGL